MLAESVHTTMGWSSDNTVDLYSAGVLIDSLSGQPTPVLTKFLGVFLSPTRQIPGNIAIRLLSHPSISLSIHRSLHHPTLCNRACMVL
jgi:hypothetical protein